MLLLSSLLRPFVRNGRLTVIDHAGARHVFGSGENGPSVTIRLADAAVEREIFFNPELKAAEAYMDGRLTFEEGGRAYDLLHLFSVNRRTLGSHPWQQTLRRYWGVVKRLQQRNPLGTATKNVRHHYDIPTPFYRLWLDDSMAYSCAYFATPETPLADAQTAKYRHIAAKLKLAPGMRVLDIGSGWGGLAIYLAKACGVEVVGLNVSTDQLAAARENAAAAGVTDKVTFVEQDYRLYRGQFDRVTSVGMMEHVGVQGFDAYFAAVKRFLKPDGFAMIHAIGRMAPPPGNTPPFIRKYIFPGSYAPSLSEVFASLERTGLWCGDCENLRLHYYWTLKAWRQRYEARREEAVAMMDERFCRMWDFYLASAEFFFLHGSNFVYQLLLAEARDAVPVIRDYIVDDERRLAAAGH
jgi:cyclopropane-fatty-acyl-phospholipid synthase